MFIYNLFQVRINSYGYFANTFKRDRNELSNTARKKN